MTGVAPGGIILSGARSDAPASQCRLRRSASFSGKEADWLKITMSHATQSVEEGVPTRSVGNELTRRSRHLAWPRASPFARIRWRTPPAEKKWTGVAPGGIILSERRSEDGR